MKAHEIASRAAEIVSGDRDHTHGEMGANHANIAAHWNAYLHARFPGTQVILQPRDVALLMVLLKVARTTTGAHNLDDYVDAVGYAAIAGELVERQAGVADGIARERPGIVAKVVCSPDGTWMTR